MIAKRVVASILRRSGALGLLPFGTRVLTYHRIIDPETLSYPLQPGMYVRPDTFRAHMKYLSQNTNVISLEELITLLGAGQKPPLRSVVVTFDDGWADNYTYAYPSLKEFRIPATLFLATAFIGTADFFWTDAVAIMLAAMARKEVALRKGPFEQELRSRVPVSESESLLEAMTVKSTRLEDTLDDTLKHLFSLDYLSRQRAVEAILACLLHEQTIPRAFLEWHEIREMADLVLVGSHSHRHEQLAELTHEDVIYDLQASYRALSQQGLVRSRAFCYPRGSYSAQTQKALAELGISWAVITEKNNKLRENPKLVGRIGIHQDISCSVSMFAARMRLSPPF